MDGSRVEISQVTGTLSKGREMMKYEDAATTLSKEFDTEVRPLIDLIDRLRGFGLDRDINLPAVAVIGDQSAGKSSVLEAISGVQLPRGTGIVTRCPLEMRMKHAEDEGRWEGKISYTDISGEVQETPIMEPDNVGNLVQKAQNDMTGHRKGISDDLITLEVTSSDVPDLTLIDLPGIARNPVEGQPDDIELRIKNLIRKYIQRQETIILVVLQCSVDIATCEALKMAKEFDTNGARTLGVLTKPDLLDKGTESGVMQVLNNIVFPLSKGYVIVKCRGQEAVAQGQSLKEALKMEEDFFNRNFSSVRPSQWGIGNLSRRLSQELKTHIKTLLPDLKDEVRSKLLETEEELRRLGPEPPDTIPEKRHIALMDQVLKGQLGKKMQASRGREFCNYMGKYDLVETFARDYIKKMQEPALKCFDDVNDKSTNVLKQLATMYFQKMPDLAGKAKETILKLRSSTQRAGKEEIRRYLHMETLVYSQDTTYSSELEKEETAKKIQDEGMESTIISGPKSLKNRQSTPTTGGFSFGASSPTFGAPAFGTFGTPATMSFTRNHEMGVDRAVLSLKSYYQIATRRLCDVVPMIIQQHIFRELVDNLRTKLMDIASDDKIIECIQEDGDVAYMRKECKSRLERLQLAELEFDQI